MPTDTVDRGFDGTTSPTSLYPTPFGTTRSLAKVQGSKPAICPKAKGHVGPHRGPLNSPRPLPSLGAKEQKVTFQLSVSLGHNSTKLWAEVYSEKAQRRCCFCCRHHRRLQTRGRDGLLCLFTMLERSRGSLTSAACSFERLLL